MNTIPLKDVVYLTWKNPGTGKTHKSFVRVLSETNLVILFRRLDKHGGDKSIIKDGKIIDYQELVSKSLIIDRKKVFVDRHYGEYVVDNG